MKNNMLILRKHRLKHWILTYTFEPSLFINGFQEAMIEVLNKALGYDKDKISFNFKDKIGKCLKLWNGNAFYYA